MATSQAHTQMMLRVDPAVAVAVLEAGHEQAYAVWLLARALDAQGRGRLELTALTLAAAEYGFSPSRWKRWLAAALELGLLTTGRHGYVRLLGLKPVCLKLGVKGLPGLPVAVLATALSSIGQWRANLWAAWHAGRSRRPDVPIARDTLEHVTGVPARTQRAYEIRAGVARQENIVVDSEHPLTPAAAEAWALAQHELRDRPGAFVVTKKIRNSKQLVAFRAYHLPNTYQSPLATTKRGRRRQINRTVRFYANHLVDDRGPGPCIGVDRTPRVFFNDSKAARDSLRAYGREHVTLPSGERVRRREVKPDPREEVYVTVRWTRAGRRVWKPLPQTPSPELQAESPPKRRARRAQTGRRRKAPASAGSPKA